MDSSPLAVGLRDQDQRFHRGLPFRRLVLGVRKLRDVVSGILQRDELAAAGQRNRFVERSFPAALSYVRHVLLSKAPLIFADFRAIRKRPNDILLQLRWPS